MNTRIESDSIGSMPVDENAYYGVQSLRAKENFPITGHLLSHEFIVNLALIKEACTITNQEAGLLEKDKAESIIKACKEVEKGLFDNQFITDEIQGGAGTSMNMNMNEVIANRANEILGGKLGTYDIVHPNDHVNMAQSTNDVIPTAGKMTVLSLLTPLFDQLSSLEKVLLKKKEEFRNILKMAGLSFRMPFR